MPYFLNAGQFLIQTLFGFFIGIFLLRLLLIAVGAPFNQPLCRFVYMFTNPVVTPLRRIVPRWRRWEFAAVAVAWLLVAIESALLTALLGLPLRWAALLAGALVQTIDWIVLIELAAILIYCVLSFFPTLRYDTNFRLVAQLVDPVVRPFRRRLPPLGGFDFSCWLASVALILVRMLLIQPLADLAGTLQ